METKDAATDVEKGQAEKPPPASVDPGEGAAPTPNPGSAGDGAIKPARKHRKRRRKDPSAAKETTKNTVDKEEDDDDSRANWSSSDDSEGEDEVERPGAFSVGGKKSVDLKRDAVVENSEGGEALRKEKSLMVLQATRVPSQRTKKPFLAPEAQVIHIDEDSSGPGVGWKMVMLLMLLLAVVIAVPLALLLPDKDAETNIPTEFPTPAPTAAVDVFEVLSANIGEDLLLGTGNESLAYDWLTNEDTLNITEEEFVTEARVVQRYVAALLYFSTGGSEWRDSLGFLSGLHECEWNVEGFPRTGQQGFTAGIQCDRSDRINRIRIAENGLRGTIPASLGLLTELETLDLLDNDLHGTIPSELRFLTKLKAVDLSSNPIGGPIPGILFETMVDLGSLSLSNSNLSGTLPSDLGALSSLRSLRIQISGLTGTLPSELGNARNLESLLLGSNRFTGTLPSEYGKLSKMESFDISDNMLRGGVPVEYSSSWEGYNEAWFLDFMAPSSQPSSSPAPTDDCGVGTTVELSCPSNEIRCATKCIKQPHKMRYRFNGVRACITSNSLTCEDKGDVCLCRKEFFPSGKSNQFECEDVQIVTFDKTFWERRDEAIRRGETIVGLYDTYYFVASADSEGLFVYNEGVIARGDAFSVTDPASIKISDELFLFLYDKDPITGRKGRLIQRVKILTSCDDNANLSFNDIFGSFQLIQFESNVQRTRDITSLITPLSPARVQVEVRGPPEAEVEYLAFLFVYDANSGRTPERIEPEILSLPYTGLFEVGLDISEVATIASISGGGAEGDDRCDAFVTKQLSCSFISYAFETDGFPDCRNNLGLNLFGIGNGECNNILNTAECGFDAGDCAEFNALFPNCVYSSDLFPEFAPEVIGNGVCDNGDLYNNANCGFDGGDCPIISPPDCPVTNYQLLGNGLCDGGIFNTEECLYDLGDCTAFNLFSKEYPNCNASSNLWEIGDGSCDGGLYNTEDCNFEDGDCVDFNAEFPDCVVENPSWLGDDECDGGVYNTEECAFDGGDCDDFNRDFPDCVAPVPYFLSDGTCDGDPYDSIECGFDGGDCP